MKKFAFALIAPLSLAACMSSGIAANELQVDNDGSGKFSGLAGMDWTPEQLKGIFGNDVCDGNPPATFDLRQTGNAYVISGHC